MEVNVRNVPERSTTNSLKNFLKPVFAKLSIRAVHTHKPNGKNFANLTFLNFDHGQKFLNHHGQIAGAPGRRPIRINTATTLIFLGQAIHCQRSNREANAFTLRVLANEEKGRQSRALAMRVSEPAKLFPITFQVGAFSCGTWEYVNGNLVFASEAEWRINGKAKFGERSMIVTLDNGIRIDFRYFGVYEIVFQEGRSLAIIFSMIEAPRFFKQTEGGIEDLLAQLQISIQSPGGRPPRKNNVTRLRIPYIDTRHEPLVGSCLVYRIELWDNQSGPAAAAVADHFQAIRKAPGMPPMTHHHVVTRPVTTGFATSFLQLRQELSSPSLELPFGILFQLQKLAQNSYLHPDTVLDLIPTVQEIFARSSEKLCVRAIRRLFNQISFPGTETEADEFDLDELCTLLDSNLEQCKEEAAFAEEFQPSTNVAIIHRVKVTPTAIRLFGPEAESNNRVLRKYPEHHEYFIRVQFCEEDGQQVRYNPRISNEDIYYKRFKRILDNGINIAGREFAFLGFSHSSLRAQSSWFIAPFVYEGSLLYDRMIIQKLGDFSLIRSPAKCAARIGQAFSDTRTAITIDLKAKQIEPDVERNGRTFSDGVGTISWDILEKLWEGLPKARQTQATSFQIRFQGAKGMISLDSRLQGEVLKLRDSMIKFEGSNSTDIEICEAAYRPLPMYLNRQLIKILEDMGVPDQFFLDIQAEAVRELRMITESPINAANFLKRQTIGQPFHLDWLIKKIHTLNYDFRQDGFLRDIVEMAVLVELRLLKHKTRIPVKQGWHLHGLMDETGFLKEGEIYCSVVVEGQTKVIVGDNIVISRAPALHPGDVQLVTCVKPPFDSPLRNLTNCICFSQHGERDLPSQLSGGDLDGDRYYIMWDDRAVPTHSYQPADYDRLDPIDIGRTVDRTDMTDFFVKFMETDQLGRIAVTHRVLADQKPDGTLNPDCIRLAEMHSTAVDFSKTGIPVDMTNMPKFQPWRPDFEAPGPHVKVEKLNGLDFEPPDHRDPDDQDDEDDDFTSYRYYESNKVLGKLYRAIDERKIFAEIKERSLMMGTRSGMTIVDELWEFVVYACRLVQWEHHKEWAESIRDMYEEKLLTIMSEFSEHPLRPLTELEAIIGNILGKTGSQSRHQRELSTSMKERFEEECAFIVNCIVRDGSGGGGGVGLGTRSEEALERSMAVLWGSLQDRGQRGGRGWRGEGDGGQLVSFRYVAAGVCLREVERFLNSG